MDLWLRQPKLSFVLPGETKSAILDRLYRAQQIIDRLNKSPELAADLDQESWEALYEVLFCRRRVPSRYRVDDQLILAILEVVRTQAHAVSSPYISFWAGTVAWHWSNSDPSISEAAEACLPLLQARWEESNKGRSLLRASQAPPPDPEDLVRPVAHNANADPKTLLRPGNELLDREMSE